ncbi:MAG: hypothetical protein ACKPGK_12060 [Verrucomicrobiota bacterium]
MKTFHLGWVLWLALGLGPTLRAESPDILSLTWSEGRPSLEFRLLPSISEYRVRGGSTPSATGPGATVVPGDQAGNRWTAGTTAGGDSGFYRMEAVPLPSETVRSGTLLHRIAYGPTPDDLDRLAVLGTDAYLEEQLAPETISEELDRVPDTGPVWRKVTLTGTGSSSTLYV